jgi:hypothetical protein
MFVASPSVTRDDANFPPRSDSVGSKITFVVNTQVRLQKLTATWLLTMCSTILEPNGGGNVHKRIYTNGSTETVLPSVFSRGKLIPPVGVCSRAKAQTCHAQFPANHSASTLITQRKIKPYCTLRMSVQTSYGLYFWAGKMPQSCRNDSSVRKRRKKQTK